MNGMVNYGILQPNVGNALAAGYQQAEDRRNALMQQQQQRQLGDIQLQNALREQRMAEEEGAAYKAAGSDMTRLQSELAGRGLGKQAMAVASQLSKQQAEKLAMLKTSTELMKQAATSIMANPTLETALGTLQSFAQRTGADVSNDIALVQSLGNDPAKIRQWAAGHAMDADKLIPKFQQFSVSGVGVKTGTVDPLTGKFVEGQTYKEEISPYQTEQLKISRGQLGVAQAGLNLRQQELALSRDPEHQKRMAYAKATGEAIAKGDINAIQQLPKITDTVEKALTNIDAMIGKAPVKDPKTGKVIQPGTAPHPGFSDVVGATWKPGMRFVQGSDAANFDALYEQVMGEVAEQAYEAIRGAGAITKDETQFATAARTRMRKAQSEDEFIKAAREYQGYLRKGLERIQTRVQGAGGAAPMSPATPGVIDFGSLR